MKSRFSLNSAVLTAALIIGAGPYVVRAAGNRPDPASVANVDMQRIYSESEIRLKAEEKVRTYGAKLGANFEEVSKLQFLTPEEVSEYNVAINAEKPGEPETKKLAFLRSANGMRQEELQKLNAKPNEMLTPADKIRLRDLTANVQSHPAVLARLEKIYQSAINEEEQKQARLGMVELRGIVAKIAKDNGFNEVFDTGSLVVASTDLTDQALRKVKPASKK